MTVRHLKDPVPPERVREVIGIVCEGFAEIAKAHDDEAKLESLARMLGRIPDVLAIPVFQQAMVTGLLMAHQAETLTADQFAALRKAAGVSQTKLAEYLNQSQGNVSAWESGTRPIPRKYVPEIRRICAEAAKIAA